MYTPVKRLSRVNATLQAALAAGERVLEVLDRHDEVNEVEDAVVLQRMKHGIEYRGVGFGYADAHGSILRNVSFSARRGEVVAIVGTSGAGKTTLVNLLPRFYDVTEGAILIDGVDVREATLASLRAQIGLVTQETVLFNDTRARQHRLRPGGRRRGARRDGGARRLRPRLHPRPAATATTP